jgi:hypothetical protein
MSSVDYDIEITTNEQTSTIKSHVFISQALRPLEFLLLLGQFRRSMLHQLFHNICMLYEIGKPEVVLCTFVAVNR